MTLYEMTNELRSLVDALSDVELADEEREQIISDTMEGIGEAEKFNAYGKVIRQLEADAEMLDGEIKRMTEAKKRAKDGAERMKSALDTYMTIKNTDKIDTGLFRFSYRATEKVIINDDALLEPRFIRQKVTEEADKTAIKQAIKAGEEVAGAVLVKERKVQVK